MRHFKKVLFLGSGDTSLAGCYKLHKRLDEAINIMGALQHPGNPLYKPTKGNGDHLLKPDEDIVDGWVWERGTYDFGDE